MRLTEGMTRVSVRKNLAPAPRLTLWVPVLIAGVSSLFWLGLVALIYR